MNRQMTYITGGCRSGKSAYALALAESLSGRRAYLATCPVIDGEMDRRIARHREERAGRGWKTIEAPVELATAVDNAQHFDVLLIDCLTLWVNNLLYRAEQRGEALTETRVAEKTDELVDACARFAGSVILVSNEVGMGLVPADPVSRHYRDCLGRCNQIAARSCDQAFFLVSGLAMPLRR